MGENPQPVFKPLSKVHSGRQYMSTISKLMELKKLLEINNLGYNGLIQIHEISIKKYLFRFYFFWDMAF